MKKRLSKCCKAEILIEKTKNFPKGYKVCSECHNPVNQLISSKDTSEKEKNQALSADYDLLKISKKEKDRLPPEFHKLLHIIKKGIDEENKLEFKNEEEGVRVDMTQSSLERTLEEGYKELNYHCPVCHTTSENLLCSEVRLCEYNIPNCAWYKHDEYEHEGYDEKFYCINCGHQLNTSELATLKI